MFNKLRQLIETKHKAIVVSFFALFFLISLSGIKDYGLNWDEEMQWKLNGEVVGDYIFHHDERAREALKSSAEKYHGPAFELVLVCIQKVFQLKETRSVYLMRHVVTFLVFYFGIIIFYFLGKRCFKDWKFAFIGCIFLALSPRIFGDSFHNSKDIPFLSFFLMSMYALLNFHEQPTYKNAIIYAFISAFAIDIRIIGILLPAFSFLFFGVDCIFALLYKKKERLYIKSFVFYCSCLVAFIILFWPILWEGPIDHFINAFKEMSQFHWNEAVFFQEVYIKATDLPWDYLPVWISITTPIPYLILFLIGLFFIFKQCLTSPINFIFYMREQQLMLMSFVVPLLMIIILESVVYDGWRHVFFIYPAFIMIGIYGLSYLYKLLNKRKSVVSILVALVICYNAVAMIQLHPNEYVYFNSFAGKDMKQVKERYEMDYYGVSSIQALEYILKNDNSPIIKINVDRYPQILNLQMLKVAEQKRILFCSLKDAAYYIGQYRYHHEEYNFDNKCFSVMVGNASIMSVFKLTENDRKKKITNNWKTWEERWRELQ